MAAKNRRKNAFVRYFTPFGIGQIFDLTMLLATIVLIVGMSIFSITTVVLLVGLVLFIVGSLIGIYRSLRVLTSGINHRAPGYKRAIVGLIIMGLLIVTAVLGLLYFFLWM